jgi:hypothetical protein
MSTFAPGRLSQLLREGLRGHHWLFDSDAIRAAFEIPDAPVNGNDADAVGKALLAMAQRPLPLARLAVDELNASARDALIRLYFRLLDRARRLDGGKVH